MIEGTQAVTDCYLLFPPQNSTFVLKTRFTAQTDYLTRSSEMNQGCKISSQPNRYVWADSLQHSIVTPCDRLLSQRQR